MDMTFHLESTASGRKSNLGLASSTRPSWPDLLARMIASREASASLATQIHRVADAEYGSFDDSAAAWVAAQAQTRNSVNPNDLGNLKSGGTISSPVAGLSRTGGRG